LLDEIHNNKFFQYWLAKRASLLAPAELKVARGLLKMGGWRNRPAREAARKIAHYMMGGDIPHPEMFAMREKMVQKKEVRLVVAGHTHHPEVRLIASDSESDRFYVNTGTWRNRIPATPDERSFGRLKSLTYVVLYPPSEDPTGRAAPYGTVDYWSGYTRHFRKKNQ